MTKEEGEEIQERVMKEVRVLNKKAKEDGQKSIMRRTVSGKCSLAYIIKTKEQADIFMKMLNEAAKPSYDVY